MRWAAKPACRTEMVKNGRSGIVVGMPILTMRMCSYTAKMVGEEHFGGFLTRKTEVTEDGKPKSWKERMEEIIVQSKKLKVSFRVMTEFFVFFYFISFPLLCGVDV